MSTAKILSIFTFIGLVILSLIAFGWSWTVLGIGLVVSAVFSIIYYIVLKRIIVDHDSEDY